MTTEKRERLRWLLQQIQVEEDRRKFAELCRELNELLEEKRARVTEKQKSSEPY